MAGWRGGSTDFGVMRLVDVMSAIPTLLFAYLIMARLGAGYWNVMLAIGMVASFFTDNLTVGFILGMLFNLPLALFGVADWIVKSPQLAQSIKRWSARD